MARLQDFVGYQPVPKATNPLRYGGTAATVEDTAGAGTITAAAATAGNAENYDCSTNNSLTVYFTLDGGTTYFPVTVTVSGATPAATTAAEAAADLNANGVFSRYATADDNSGSLRITLLPLGPNAKFYVGGTANTPLGFTQVADGTAAAGGGTNVATFTITVTAQNGDILPKQKVTLNVYDAASAGALVAASTLQNATKGTFDSGENTETAVMYTDVDGKITAELGLGGGASPGSAFLDVNVDQSNNDPSRTEITTGS